MKDVKETKEGWNKETAELIEIAREVVRVVRKIREEKPAPVTKEETPYEKVVKTNPYISNNNIIYYR